MGVQVDVLCVGTSAYDLTFGVEAHPQPDEKLFATSFVGCGGGPAANAAVTVARLGGTAVFAGYLGNDMFGQLHLEELKAEGVLTDWIVRGENPTPVSAIIAKPDGQRALIAYQAETRRLPADSIDFSRIEPKVILFDGHEPELSLPLATWAREKQIPTVLDAGSLHVGTEQLAERVDYLLVSEKFAQQFTREQNEQLALGKLNEVAPFVAITLGERGLIWKNKQAEGFLPAFTVNAIDTTGAGDTFHGAFAWCLAQKMAWQEGLRFASAAAALCCTKQGARHGIPNREAVERLINQGV